MKNKRLNIILSTATLILLIPIIAMQFTDEVSWTLIDFLIAALLLLSTGLTIDYILRKIKLPILRLALSMAVLAMFILIWAELAVGIFGTHLSGN